MCIANLILLLLRSVHSFSLHFEMVQYFPVHDYFEYSHRTCCCTDSRRHVIKRYIVKFSKIFFLSPCRHVLLQTRPFSFILTWCNFYPCTLLCVFINATTSDYSHSSSHENAHSNTHVYAHLVFINASCLTHQNIYDVLHESCGAITVTLRYK